MNVATVEIRAEMTATVFRVYATPGDELEEGDPLIILESMKMEIPVEAPADGKVVEVKVKNGDTVQEGDLLATFEEEG